ncbi:MAG: hypothetical protein HWD59_00080 [Coxiellaceae bacterium]|nr:MAG: hypothetical protein HWD59_00080 [Coxiellaceae bacterium]
MKTRSSHSAFFHNFVPTLVRPEKTKYEWFLAFDNYTIRYQIETETKIARKGSKETPLREGSLIIALDVDCVEESDRKDVLDVFNMARYFPGAAVDKNCIHDLGDDIFSIKSKKQKLEMYVF